MLFAKDLKAAFATLVATVGLLGFGTANASILLKDRNEAGAQTPLYFAKEAYMNSLGARGGLAVRATSTAGMTGSVTDENIDALLDPAVDAYYFRFDFGGPGCVANGNLVERGLCPVFTSGFLSNVGVATISGTYAGAAGDALGPPGDGFVQTVRASGGGAGQSHVLYRIEVNASNTTSGSNSDDEDGLLQGGLIAAGEWSVTLGIRDQYAIELPRTVKSTGAVCYTVTFSVWDDPGEATGNGNNFVHKSSANYACLIDTVTAGYVAQSKAVTTTVESGFTRFMVETGVTATTATLGNASVTIRSSMAHADADAATAGAQAVTRTVTHPATGANITAADVVGSVDFEFRSGGFTYSSPFGFGEYSLGSVAGARYVGDTAQKSADLTNRTDATGRATRAATDNVRMSLTAAGAVPFRVNVGANTTANAALYEPLIGQGSYTVTWQIDRPGTLNDPAAVTPKPAGTIMRDGTTVRVGYLTVATDFQNDDVNNLVAGSGTISGSYNQRLIVTNHSSRDIEWRLGSFVAEPNSTVTPKESDRWDVETNETSSTIIGNIGAQRQMVVKLTDLLEIEGGSRTGGVLSLSAGAGEISVVTTQVTRPEGQTDTVRHWPLQ